MIEKQKVEWYSLLLFVMVGGYGSHSVDEKNSLGRQEFSKCEAPSSDVNLRSGEMKRNLRLMVDGGRRGRCEKAYDSLSINDARKILLFSSDKELFEYVKEEHPEWEIKNGFVIFQKAKESAPCKETPSLQFINQALSYARELERIV
ncbi:hypothetical protein ACSBR2_038739 [Camellia fascicularis]